MVMRLESIIGCRPRTRAHEPNFVPTDAMAVRGIASPMNTRRKAKQWNGGGVRASFVTEFCE